MDEVQKRWPALARAPAVTLRAYEETEFIVTEATAPVLKDAADNVQLIFRALSATPITPALLEFLGRIAEAIESAA